MENNRLDFGDFDLIFKVTGGLRLLENGFLHPISWRNGWILTKLAQLYCCDEKELIRFWWPWPHFQGHRRAWIVGKWIVCTLSPEQMDGNVTKLAQLYYWDRDKSSLDFGDLDPNFKVIRLLRFWKMVPIDHTHTQKRNYRYNLFQQ